MDEFYRIKRLPPYVFAIVNDLKTKARAHGEDIIDLGMGNPDLGTPKHIVAKLIEATQNPKNHRYSASRGITRLRVAITRWYRERYGVELDPESEAIVTIGAKEGLAHLTLAVLQPGDGALVPNPTYPIPSYSVVIADGDLRSVPLTPDGDFFARLDETAKLAWPKAKLLILSFPHNPTTMCVDRGFFEKVVAFAREHRLMVVHDFAYADFCFDGYRPPSFLEVPGWSVPTPRGTMFVWAPIPEPFRALGSLEFAKMLIEEARVAVSPGIGFGEYGEGYVRFALVENEQRIKQALRGLKQLAS